MNSRAATPSKEIVRYLGTRSIQGPWHIEGNDRSDFQAAVVIPALAESRSLFDTLCSLCRNPSEFLSRTLILVVVNHRADSRPEDKADNLKTLQRLKTANLDLDGLELAWVDAASPGLELPAKRGGVGLARKIGFDLSLARLSYIGHDPFLAALDADTLVRSDYLPTLFSHFQKARAGGAAIPFCHQAAENPHQQRAIERYELFLRSYVLGLYLAGSPYAFHAVGSAMACRADAYAKAGGMNCRAAGEDFYFLQHLAKTVGVSQIQGTVVYPAARTSHRTPFGTGQSVARLLSGENDAVLFYQADCFKILRHWLELVHREWHSTETELLSKAQEISVHLAAYLEGINFSKIWQRLKNNHKSREAFLSGFHGWFDGLKTIKLIHILCSGPFPKVEPAAALPALLKWADLEPTEELERQIRLLRKYQAGEPL